MSRRRAKGIRKAPEGATRENLLSALKAFADVELPPETAGQSVWLCVGHEDPNGCNPQHLSINDFRRAQRMVQT